MDKKKWSQTIAYAPTGDLMEKTALFYNHFHIDTICNQEVLFNSRVKYQEYKKNQLKYIRGCVKKNEPTPLFLAYKLWERYVYKSVKVENNLVSMLSEKINHNEEIAHRVSNSDILANNRYLKSLITMKKKWFRKYTDSLFEDCKFFVEYCETPQNISLMGMSGYWTTKYEKAKQILNEKLAHEDIQEYYKDLIDSLKLLKRGYMDDLDIDCDFTIGLTANERQEDHSELEQIFKVYSSKSQLSLDNMKALCNMKPKYNLLHRHYQYIRWRSSRKSCNWINKEGGIDFKNLACINGEYILVMKNAYNDCYKDTEEEVKDDIKANKRRYECKEWTDEDADTNFLVES